MSIALRAVAALSRAQLRFDQENFAVAITCRSSERAFRFGVVLGALLAVGAAEISERRGWPR